MMKTVLTLAALFTLAACASSPQTTSTASAEGTKTVQQEGETSLTGPIETGTRLSKRGTERIVRSVGNQTFKQDTKIQSLSNDVGARSN